MSTLLVMAVCHDSKIERVNKKFVSISPNKTIATGSPFSGVSRCFVLTTCICLMF